MYNSAKSNVLVFRIELLKNMHVPELHLIEFVINNTAIDRVSTYKYLGHCINDELSDDDDMTRQRNKVGECIDQKVLHVYRKCRNASVPYCTICFILVGLPRGSNTDVNHYENRVLLITIFFVNSPI